MASLPEKTVKVGGIGRITNGLLRKRIQTIEE